MDTPVKTQIQGAVLVATIHNPPVNALGQAVRQALLAALAEAEAREDVQAVLIHSEGRLFSGGADIREFSKAGALSPTLPELCNGVEACCKPVVVAAHGEALGGALELLLSGHYRLGTADIRVGFPEVNLGLLPGAGGTQRAARIAGIAATLDMVLDGKPRKAEQALALGLIDRVVPVGEARSAGLAWAAELARERAPVRRASEQGFDAEQLGPAQQAIAAAREMVRRRFPASMARARIVDVVAAALDRPFAEGLAFERQNFLACRESDEHKGIVHAFMAERAVSELPELKDVKPREVGSLGIVGGGTMGTGIAISAIDAGLSVVMVERDEAALAKAQERLQKHYGRLVEKQRLNEQGLQQALARWHGSTSYEALAEVDVAIEAVFEDMAVKKAVFAELDRICKPGAVLATNTSYLDIDEIAGATARPADVLGMHFFSPANVSRLMEVVVATRTAPEVVATAIAVARRMRKLAVRSGLCDGFIGNRIMNAYRTAADHLLEDGASPYLIDTAMRGFGFAMGPYQVADLAGGDIGWANRQRRAPTRDPAARYVKIPDRLCERGWLGQKTGRGYYVYGPGGREGAEDPEVLVLIDEERRAAGVTPRAFSEDEVVRRYLAAMVNEAARVLEDGIARRPLDIDVVFLAGYGFPRHRGGPLKYADTVGVQRILDDIRRFAEEDPLFWRPAPLLVKLSEEGGEFGRLNSPAN